MAIGNRGRITVLHVDTKQQLRHLVRPKAQWSHPAPPHLSREGLERHLERLAGLTHAPSKSFELAKSPLVENNRGWFKPAGVPIHEAAEVWNSIELGVTCWVNSCMIHS